MIPDYSLILLIERSPVTSVAGILRPLVDAQSLSKIEDLNCDADDVELWVSFLVPSDTAPKLLKGTPPDDDGRLTLATLVTIRRNRMTSPETVEIEIWPTTSNAQRILFGSMQFRTSIVNAMEVHGGVQGQVAYEGLIPRNIWTRDGGRENDDFPERTATHLRTPIELRRRSRVWWKRWLGSMIFAKD